MMTENHSVQQSLSGKYEDILLHPALLPFFDFFSLVRMSEVSVRYHALISQESQSVGYWMTLCHAYCAYCGLYSSCLWTSSSVMTNFRKHFFEDLWPLRYKWRVGGGERPQRADEEAMSYQVRVACRFRPGDVAQGKVNLPLHQFLRLKRQQQLQPLPSLQGHDGNQGNDGESKSKILVGEKDPEEFVDPILGSLMRDPVLLPTSNRIVDRSVAVQCILRGGRDPFNNKKLSLEMLQPQTDLALRIQQWKDRPNRHQDVGIDVQEAKQLVQDTAVNQDLLDALLEIERMQATLRKAKQEAKRSDLFGDDERLDQAGNGPETNLGHLHDGEGNEFIDAQMELPTDFLLANNAQSASSNGNRHEQEEDFTLSQGGLSKKAESARVVEVNGKNNYVSMHVPGSGIRPFYFYNVHPANTTQVDIYQSTTQESISAVLNGCNACVMCYGQTGSGKTYTFLGPERCLEDDLLDAVASKDAVLDKERLPQSMGVVLRTAQELFQAQQFMKRQGISMSMVMQVVEVYEEKLTDLLTGKPCQVRRENGQIAGACEVPCHSFADLLQQLRVAHSRQRYAETAMNQRSSRAHTVLIFHVTQQVESIPCLGKEMASERKLIQSQLHLVDLAGSERVKKSKVTGQRMREAVGINSSLLVLGKVITALVKQHSHVPYYESKLTTILKAAFGGNSHTIVMVNARSDDEHAEETLQSLRFGERCSMISNSLRQTATSFESTLKTLDEALMKLEAQLQSLAQRNKQHLDSYQALQVSYEALQRKRTELVYNHQQQQPQPSQPLQQAMMV